MTYHISRNGQVFGPYTIEDIHRYLASGNVLPTDLAKSPEMSQWVSVSQLISAPATVLAPVPATGYADPPPNLHWALLTVIDIFTCSVFSMVWNLVLASWFNKINPHRRVLAYYIIATVLMIAQGFVQTHYQATHHISRNLSAATILRLTHGLYSAIFSIAVWIFRIVTRFNFRNALEEHYNTVEPIGLRLSGILTFFFGGIYFQYKLNEINQKKSAIYFRVPSI